MNTEEKLDHLIVMMEHLDRKIDDKTGRIAAELHEFRHEMKTEMQEFRNEIETELHEFRHEMKQETTMLRNQVAALTVAINTVITENDAAHAKIIRVQEQHSIDIMELRSAI